MREPYLLEFMRIGNQIRVSACDPETGVEAVVFGPAKATQKELSDLAVRKLQYVLKKKSEPS